MLLLHKWHHLSTVALLTLLLMWRPTTTKAAVLAAWSSLGQWATSPFDNYTQYTFRFKAFDPVRLVPISEQYDEAKEKCISTQSRLPRFEDLAGELFQRFILKNSGFRQVGVTKEVVRTVDNGQNFRKVRQWSMEPGKFFLASALPREKQLIELEDSAMVLTMRSSDSMEIGGKQKQPTIIMCVKERHLPRPPPPPPPQPLAPVAPSSSSNIPCACGAGVSQAGGGSGLDFAWPLAAVAFLGVLCLSLATALLIVCRTTRRRAEEVEEAAIAEAHHADAGGVVTGVGKNGNSIPRTASSLMDFPGGQHHHQHHYHLQEKAHSLAAQATMPRRPRVIHHGQVHTNGYLTLGSIQARKQRELMHHPGPRDLGLSEPPSPNNSIARSDYQHR